MNAERKTANKCPQKFLLVFKCSIFKRMSCFLYLKLHGCSAAFIQFYSEIKEAEKSRLVLKLADS